MRQIVDLVKTTPGHHLALLGRGIQVGIAERLTAASFNGGLLNAGRSTEVFRPICSFRNSELLLRRVRDMDCALFMFFGIVPAVHIRS